MHKVLVSDNLSHTGIDTFKTYENIHVDVKTGLSAEQLAQIIGDYEGLIVRSATQFKGEVLEKAVKMKVVGRAGAGVDNIDVSKASEKGILVMNTPGGNSAAVAELTIALIMALSRNVVKASMTMKDGQWEKKNLAKSSYEVAGKTLGLLGAGNIGRLVAKKAHALEMDVQIYDPFLTREKAEYMRVKKVEKVEDIYRTCDYLSLHLPRNADTLNLINENAFNQMKDGVFIINCSRGGIINESDLLKALNSGKVKCAALDVYQKEPVEPDDALVLHPNVVCTPHLGASTKEAQEKVAIAIAHQVSNYLISGEIKHALNADKVEEKICSSK